jgi:putative addiction module component (TIGR02574 family)
MAAPNIKELFALDVQERLALVEELWDSISKDAQLGAALPLTESERRKLDDRLREDDDDPDSALSWEEARGTLRKQP